MTGSDVRRLRHSRSGLLLGAGFLTLSLFIASAVIFSVKQRGSDALLRRVLGIEIHLGDVFSALQDAEIGQRGYMLTDDDAFLTPYRSASDRIEALLQTLRHNIQGIGELDGPFDALATLAAEKKRFTAHTLQLVEIGRREEAIALVRNGTGRLLMEQIRGRIEAMDEHLDQLVDRRQRTMRQVGLAIAVSTTAAVVLLGCVALAAMREVRRRSELSRFLPGEIAPRLAAGDQSLRTGREVPVAIVFVDIRGSTALAETLPVARLSTLLSDFRGEVTAAAQGQRGLVDKFIGDGALVIFGAHEADPDAALHALNFARDLRKRHALSQMKAGQVRYEIGLGVHFGVVFCGIVGSESRLEFTVLGDAVNVAARLEKETKSHGVDLLVSEPVLREAGEPLAAWRRLDSAALRGRQEPVAIYAEPFPAKAESSRAIVMASQPSLAP